MIAYTGGSFDGLHVGHLELLNACRGLAGPDGHVVVSLNRDDFIRRYKGKPPVHPFVNRREMLLALRTVDAVVANVGDEDSKPAIDVVQPDVIVIGDDWYDAESDEPEARYMHQLDVTPGWLAARGLHVEYVPRTRGVSSSALRGAA